MTFNEMVVALQDHLGATGEVTMIERMVNQGKDRYVHAQKWPHLESSDTQLFTTGVRTYAAPDLAQSIVGIENASGIPVKKQERDTYDELYRPSTATAVEPSMYAEEGTDVDAIHQFHVWPDPSTDTAGTIRFMVRVPDLTSGGGTYDHIPEEHHFAVLKAAETEFHEQQGQEQKAALAEAKFTGMINQLAGAHVAPVLADGSEK